MTVLRVNLSRKYRRAPMAIWVAMRRFCSAGRSVLREPTSSSAFAIEAVDQVVGFDA
jgi:hypothetical protein